MLATPIKHLDMNSLRKLILFISLLFLSFYSIAQQSCVSPNPVAHIILIPAGIPKLDGENLPNGSIISAVYQSGDTLRCAGQVTWQNKSVILQAYGKSSDGDEGYLADEPIKFRIILPNGCTIEDELITTKFQEIENNQNPGFQNLAINRLEQLDATSPRFNVQLISKDTIQCNENQIEIIPSVDVLGATFEWSTDNLGIISRKSNLIASSAGVYKLVVSLKGCLKSQEVEITDLRNTLTLEVTPNEPAICPGESITLEAFTNQKSAGFTWNIGAKSNAIEISKAAVYSVTVTNEAGCFVEKSVEVRLKSKPELDLKTNLDFCQGDSITLNAPINVSYRYKWSTGDTSAQITTKKAGTYSLSVTNAENCSTIDSIKLNVSALPQLSLPSLVQVCDGASTRLTASTDASFIRWNTGDTTATIVVSKAGNYQVDARSKIGCRASATSEVISVSIPTSNLPSELVRCENEIAELDPQIKQAKYQWNTGDTTQIIRPSRSGLYIVKVILGQGCSVTDSTTVSYSKKPEIDLGPNLTLCDGLVTTIKVQDTIAYRYRWNTGDKLSSINVSKSGLYTITVSNIANCQTIDSVRLNIQASPPQVLPDSLISCKGLFSKLVAGEDQYDYKWSSGQNTLLIIPENSGKYVVTITDTDTKCKTIDSTLVLVRPSPEFNLPDTLILCPGNKIEIKTLEDTALKYIWNTGATSKKIETNTPGVYSVEISNQFGCSRSDSTKLINPPPRIPKWPNPIPKCENESVSLNGDNLGQVTSWNTGETKSSISVNKTGTYVVSFLDKYGCPAKDSAKVIFNKNPVLSLPDSLRLCQGGTQKLDVQNSGKSYIWNTGSTAGVITIQNPQLYAVTVSNEFGCKSSDSTRLRLWTNPSVNLQPVETICPDENLILDARSFGQKFIWNTGATTGLITTKKAGIYQVTVTDANGCSGQGNTRVDIQNLPIASIENVVNFVCLGDTTTLTGKGGTPLRWLDQSNTSKLLNPNRILVKPISKTTYGFIAENMCGTDTAYMSIDVKKVRGSVTKDTAILLGRQLTLKASGGKIYQWSSPGLQISNSSNATIEVAPKDSTYFVVTIQDENKCSLRDTVFVSVYSDVTELIKPINLFTPNGDGKNDVLKFKDLNVFNTNKITVFNRWGGIVFQKSNYQNDWDGSYNDSPLPPGVYYYVLELDEAVIKSSLTLIRN